jgi:sugar phosphate isomerase/epimerase
LRIALQLYTVRELAARDLLATIDAVAAVGFDGVELAGLHGTDPRAVRDRCARLGLAIVGSHVALERLEERLPEVLAELDHLGLDHVVVPVSPRSASATERRAGVKRIRRAAETLRAEGIQPVFHNHWWELDPAERTWEEILGIHGLQLELDLGWAWVAGEDIGELLRRHADRIRLVHLKDFIETPDGHRDVPLGDGQIDFTRVIEALEHHVDVWAVAEQDDPGDDPLAAAARSLAWVRSAVRSVP